MKVLVSSYHHRIPTVVPVVPLHHGNTSTTSQPSSSTTTPTTIATTTNSSDVKAMTCTNSVIVHHNYHHHHHLNNCSTNCKDADETKMSSVRIMSAAAAVAAAAVFDDDDVVKKMEDSCALVDTDAGVATIETTTMSMMSKSHQTSPAPSPSPPPPLPVVLKGRSSTHPDISTDTTAAATASSSKAESIHGLEVAHLEKLAQIQNKSPWEMLCQIINCKFAFKKQFNGRKYNWIQLAGHAGRFKPGEREGYILKLMSDLERQCLEMLKSDPLRDFVPIIDNTLFDADDSKYYTEMQDLLYGFEYPAIMDIKIGVRTFLENESGDGGDGSSGGGGADQAKETKPRRDLYERLVELAPDEPTEEEHRAKAITKRRYMSWRERSTCSATLGFRIEAIKKNQVSEKEFYSVKTKKEVQYHFKHYADNKKHILRMYLSRLIALKESLLNSKFFESHEMIGSSLLFVHDEQKANIWMIDFGKTRPLPEGVRLTHVSPWLEGNYEDGYLIGIQSLIDIFQEISS